MINDQTPGGALWAYKQLEIERKEAADTIEALRAENARLKELLKPFADVAEHDICESLTDADIFRPMTREYSRASMLTVGDLRNCKRILDGSTIE